MLADDASQGSYVNQASSSYYAPDALTPTTSSSSLLALIDPRGRVRDFSGAMLIDYTGFTVGLYAANSGAGASSGADPQMGSLVQLTPTVAQSDGNSPVGIYPNLTNANPYALSNDSGGSYSFLFDPSRGQLDSGKEYLLVVNPPAGSGYPQRRIDVKILSHAGTGVMYSAVPLDGLPLNGTLASMTAQKAVTITDGTRHTSDAMGLLIGVGRSESVTFSKVGDHASAEPGDTVGYQVTIFNTATSALATSLVTDTLPAGFSLVKSSIRCHLGKTTIPITIGNAGKRVFTVALQQAIAPQQTCVISYAATLTPAAINGDGRNVATFTAMAGGSNEVPISAGPSAYTVHVRPGILSDLGTIIGRVFIDSNGDSEQHGHHEIGIGGAVILLDDGLQVTTDPNGLFSISNVSSGTHAAVLDPLSTPGCVLARTPLEQDNSRVRLVRLEAGGMARLNFALVPAPQKAIRR